MIRKGDRVEILPEWREPGEEKIVFIAVEDEYLNWQETGVVTIEAQLGWTINPQQLVRTYMLRKVGE